MMIYTFKQDLYELVKKHVTECYEGKNELIFDERNKSVTVDDSDILEFKIAADDAIIEFGMVNQDYLTPLGYELQALYDEIYHQSKNKDVTFYESGTITLL